MAWLRHGQYYYRSRRRGDTVITEYIGAGEIASLIARLDELERQKRQLEREAFQLMADEQDELDRQLDDVGADLGAVVDAVYLVAGFRQHKRQWRKARG